MPTAHLITDPAELPALRPAWQELWLATPDATFFQTLEWLECYWRHYGERQQLRVIVVEEAGRPIGILPLTILPEATAIGEVALLTYPLHNWGSTYGPVGPASRETLAAALELLAQQPRDWELLDLRWIDGETPAGGELPLALDAAGFDTVAAPWQELYQIDLTAGWDAYFASRTSGFRNNIRRAQKRVLAAGQVEFIRFRPAASRECHCLTDASNTLETPLPQRRPSSSATAHEAFDPRLDLFDECVALAERSWQGSSDSGTTLSHAGVRDFLREAHVAAARTGTLDLVLIRIDGRPVAFAYNYHHRGYVFGMRSGWNPDYAEAGLGTYLYAAALEDSCRRGDRLYDLGANYFEAKQRWINRVAPTIRLRHYPLFSPRAQMLRVKHWLTEPRGEAAFA